MEDFKVRDGRALPFFQVDNRLIDDCELDAAAKIIYVALCRYSNNGAKAFPSLKLLAEKCAISQSTVKRRLNELEEKKYIKRINRCNQSGSKTSNLYIVLDVPNRSEGPNPRVRGTQPHRSEGPNPRVTVTHNKEQIIKNNIIKNNLKRDIVEQSSHIEQSSTDAPKNAHIEIIDYLNQTCGTAYRSTSKKTQQLINARLKEGFTIENFKVVIYKMNLEWKTDKKMNAYLRPETLFGPKFESYLNRKEKEITLNDVEIEIDYDNLWG